uniref:Permease of the drug/metabolite transporter (DMT) superfamily n=1 Tax=Piromyces sp. TaxID=45796 RepID=A0A2S1TYW9_PIRSP|nr:Permease of the drug/metabolite transporter (DMT) superfamily [Piromyces sp.]
MESNNSTNVEISIKDNINEKEITDIIVNELKNETLNKEPQESDNAVKDSRLRRICVNRFWMYILAIICTFLWGSAFPSIKLGYEEFHINSHDLKSIFLFAGMRFTFAGLMIIVAYCIIKRELITPKLKEMPDILTLGFVGITLQYIIFYFGLSNSTGVKCSIINSCNTFFTVILAHFLFKNDRITIRKAIGCVIGFVGVIIINVGLDFIFGGKDDGKKLEWSFTFQGEGAIMTSCFLSSVVSVLIKVITRKGSLYKFNRTNEEDDKIKEKKKPDIIMITGYQMFLGALVIDVIALVWMIISPIEPIEGSDEKPYRNVSFKGYLLMIHMSMLSAVAFSIWNTLIRFNDVGKIAFFNFLIPIFGSILSGIFLGEELFKIENLIALVLVCIGVIIVC